MRILIFGFDFKIFIQIHFKKINFIALNFFKILVLFFVLFDLMKIIFRFKNSSHLIINFLVKASLIYNYASEFDWFKYFSENIYSNIYALFILKILNLSLFLLVFLINLFPVWNLIIFAIINYLYIKFFIHFIFIKNLFIRNFTCFKRDFFPIFLFFGTIFIILFIDLRFANHTKATF